jgi:hypothetical protein
MVMVRKPEGRRPLDRYKLRWEVIVKTDHLRDA